MTQAWVEVKGLIEIDDVLVEICAGWSEVHDWLLGVEEVSGSHESLVRSKVGGGCLEGQYNDVLHLQMNEATAHAEDNSEQSNPSKCECLSAERNA